MHTPVGNLDQEGRVGTLASQVGIRAGIHLEAAFQAARNSWEGAFQEARLYRVLEERVK